MRIRRGGKPDANNQDIADLARRLGAQVVITTGVGFDFPDQVWGFQGVTILVEVDNPARKGGKRERERKARQARFRANWRGGPVVNVATGDDVIRLITGPTMRQWTGARYARTDGATAGGAGDVVGGSGTSGPGA